MGFLTAVGAVVVGSVSVVVLLTAVLFGWTLADEKLKSRFFEPTLMLALMIAIILVGWILHATAGGAGVFGVVLGVAVWGYVIFSSQSKRPKNNWEKVLSWLDRR